MSRKNIEEHRKVCEAKPGNCPFEKHADMADMIYAVSDIHQSGISNVNPDGHGIVLIAGDFMGAGYFLHNNGRKWLENKFFPWCRKHSDKKIVITPGNHDRFIEREMAQGNGIRWPENVKVAIGEKVDVGGVSIFGTPWCSRHNGGAYEGGSDKLREEYSKIPTGVDILMTHMPPRVEGEDIDTTSDARHVGSRELYDEIVKKKPKLVICGHIHTGSHKPIKIGDTTVVNVAAVGERRDVVEFSGRTIKVRRNNGEIERFDLDETNDGRVRSKASKAKIRDYIREFTTELTNAADAFPARQV